MGQSLKNNAKTTLSGSIIAGDLTINLAAASGALFPAAGSGVYFYATLVDNSNNIEIVKVTSRATDACTVLRGQDGTTARAYSTGDKFELRPCNAMLQSLAQEAISGVATTGTDTYAATLAPVPTAYNTNQVYAVIFAAENTSTAPTLNLNSLGAKTIKKGNSKALAPGDLQVNVLYFLLYNGTDFILLNPSKGTLRGKQTVWIPAGAFTPATTNGAAGPSVVETTTNKINYRELDFDQTTEQYAHALIKMPKSWDLGTFTARFAWGAASSTGDVIWGIQAVAVSDGDALDVAQGTAQEVTDTLIATADLHLTAATAAVTVSGTPAADDLVFFRVYRKAAAGGDTLAATARLLGVELTINFDKADDS
jgi:hypothetical protein